MPKNIGSFKLLRGFSAVAVLASGCVSAPDQAAHEHASQARLALDATPPIVIDDFKTGAATFSISTTGLASRDQVATSAIGQHRCETLYVTDNPFSRGTLVEIATTPGFLALDSGFGVSQALLLTYGGCNGPGLDQKIGPEYTGIEVELATLNGAPTVGALDHDTAGGIELFSDGGHFSSMPFGIKAGSPTGHGAFADLVGDVDMNHVQQIVIEIQTGGPLPGHDYVLQRIAVVHRD